ncbi:hypothetical protein [uncultured Aquimarina sp.]|uniref:hypothetical protein n=1 Tax=uncultured Aquimarina sp. TaxID=575652 RepID=UPI00261C346F|nr:hypothetical protein [uncultured Aquimarina sp.]
MKKVQLILVCLFITAFASAQKVKVKKGEVFIDKVKVAHIEKVKGDNAKYYQISDLEKKPIFKAQEMLQSSLLFGSDKTFPFRAYYGDQITDTIIINKKNYWLSEKRVIQYALEVGIFSVNGFDPSKTKEIASQTPKRPTWILERLDEEKELLTGKGHKVERDFDYTNIFVKSYAAKNAISQLNKSMVNQMKFDIYQGDPAADSVLIGHGIYESGTVNGEYLFILNTKKVPVGSYNKATFKIYDLKEEQGLLDHSLGSLSSDERNNTVREMAIKLIQKEVL